MKTLIRGFYAAISTLSILSAIVLSTRNYEFKAPKPTLNVFVWGEFLPENIVKDFEKETGIHLNLHLFASNEELLSKVKNTRGQGYDVFVPSDYAVKLLAEEGYIKPLKHKKIKHLKEIDPTLLGHAYDPDNFYSIPFAWEVFGIAFDSTRLSIDDPVSFDLLFPSKPPPYRLVMTPDPVEAVNLSSFALFGDKTTLSAEDKLQIQSLLKRQKSSVEAYSDYFRTKYLLTTGNAPLALIKTSLYFDIVKESPHIELCLPREAIFTSIENLTVSSSCKNEKAAYAFIEYVNRPEVLRQMVDRGPIFPARQNCLLQPENSYEEQFQNVIQTIKDRKEDMRFFSYLLRPEETQQIWVHTKTTDESPLL